MRNPLTRRDKLTYDAHSPHPFQEARDAGLAAFSAGGGPAGRGSGSNVTQIAMTSAFVRTEHCAVPGCGKPRADEVHAPED